MDNTFKNQSTTQNASESLEISEKLGTRNGYGESPLFELADRLKSLKDEKKEIEANLKSVNDMIFEVDSALSEAMILNETQNFTRGGTMFCLTTSTKASPVAGRKNELYTLLKDMGYGDLVQETVNANSLSSFVKEQIIENDIVNKL